MCSQNDMVAIKDKDEASSWYISFNISMHYVIIKLLYFLGHSQILFSQQLEFLDFTTLGCTIKTLSNYNCYLTKNFSEYFVQVL